MAYQNRVFNEYGLQQRDFVAVASERKLATREHNQRELRQSLKDIRKASREALMVREPAWDRSGRRK